MEQEKIIEDMQEIEELKPTLEHNGFVLVTKSNGIETVIPLEEGQEVVIGCSPECTSCFDDQYMSRKHFRAKLVNGCLEIEDLNSKNGLFKKVQGQTQLEKGCQLLAGMTTFSFEQKE